ncbi:MAG: TolC family protein [Muribaculum sp.]|nr:TolC family protein [Muribaculum sp.]
MSKKIWFQLLMGLLLSMPATLAASGLDPAKELTDSVPGHWVYNEHFNQALPTEDNWWANLDDPVLDTLIALSETHSADVLIAARRITVARQALNSARSAYMPTVNFSAGWSKSRSSGALGDDLVPATTADYFDLGLSMSWEIDVFGKIYEKSKQQKALWNASRADYAAVMTALSANIAKAYVQLREYQAQWAVAKEHISSQAKIVEITEARHEAGLASMLDVSQARQVYYSTQASMPTLEASIRNSVYSICLLVGVYPRELSDLLNTMREMPDYQQIVPVGVPMELLRRRPDIVESEYQLAAAASALGIAKKDFLPTLTLNGSIGTSAHKIDNLFKNQSLTYAIAPTLTWTVFDGLSRKYNAISAREQMEIEIHSYNSTVMTAVEEVDVAISSYIGSLQNIDFVEQVIEQSRKALDLSVDLYKRGLSPFNNVVSAQMSLLEYQNNLISSKANALTSLITLYEALGGGWDASSIE